MNSAKIAEKQGYRVSDAEVMADLTKNAELSFRQNINHLHLGVANSRDYMNEQLRRFGMDRRTAIKTWRNVMLFRRLFHDMGNSVFVTPFTFEKFNSYANEAVKGEMYRLPEQLRLGNFSDLQKFETYLSAVSKRNENDLLSLPTVFLTPFEIEKSYPELVQKHYLLEVSEVDKKSLSNRVSVKEMWNWQVDDTNWKVLTKEFPDLGVKDAQTEESRFLVLDGLDDRTRTRVNTFSRQKMVDAHPEWIDQALEQAEPKQMNVAITKKGGTTPFKGLEDREKLIRLLDRAPLKEQSDTLAKFSPNEKQFYRIIVIERGKGQDVMTFAEANQKGILDKIVERELKAYHKNNPDEFSKEYVRDQVAQKFFAKVLKEIQKEKPSTLSNDLTASLRFHKHLRQTLDKVKKNSESEVLAENETPTLKNQWKLIKTPYVIERSSTKETFNKDEAFAMNPKSWSTINTLPNGDLYFFFMKEKGLGLAEPVSEQVAIARSNLSDDAKQMLMKQLLQTIKEKNAISLHYLDSRYEEEQNMDD